MDRTRNCIAEPKVSVVIPVHNGEKYLAQSVGSVLEQTLRDIEIICVNDASTDRTAEILDQYAMQDARVKVIHREVCGSALQARKQGVAMAQGEYIMFLDADDYYAPNACETAYGKIDQTQVDVLQFSSQPLRYGDQTEAEMDTIRRYLRPYGKELRGERVLRACFVEKRYSSTLWNKIYSVQVCKKAFSEIEDKNQLMAEDVYTYFVLAYYASSYYGWESEPLYFYCWGQGLTMSGAFDLKKFDGHCSWAEAIGLLERFCNEKDVDKKISGKILERFRREWLEESVWMWENRLPEQDREAGLEMLCRHWGGDTVISFLAERYWEKPEKLAQKLTRLPDITLQKKPVKKIGIYYFQYQICCGISRVLSILIPTLVNMGYEVVLITEIARNEESYPVLEGVIWETVPEAREPGAMLRRLGEWERIVKQYGLDVILYHAWVSPMLLWDMLQIQCLKTAFLVQAHSVFSFEAAIFELGFFRTPAILALADGLVVLSETDKAFWNAYHPNVAVIKNPVSEALRRVVPKEEKEKTVIWAGRFSPEKRPECAIHIMEKIVRKIPDAKLYMLGGFSGAGQKRKFQRLIADNSLQNSVVLAGRVSDVDQWMEKASVHLLTSKYEGFPMVLLEAQAHGLPTVMFNMPYLDLGHPENGVIGVRENGIQEAADAVIRLLSDEAFRDHNSRLARNSFEALAEYDYAGAWKAVLSGEFPAGICDATMRTVIQTTVTHYEMGWLSENKKEDELPKKLSNRILRAVPLIPKRILGGFRCLRDHGLLYTLGRVKVKIQRLFLGKEG